MPKLQYRFNSATKDISLYDTKPNDKNIAVQIDGKTYYAGLLPVGHSRASNLRIYRDGEAYAVAKEGGEKVALEDYSWAEIAAIIKAGNAAEYFAVGDTRPITLGSVKLDKKTDMAGTWRVQILGIDHNAEIEGYNRVHFAIGKTADDTIEVTFYGQKMTETMSNAGGWEACEIRTWLNNTFYNALPSDLRAVITACTKYTDNVGNKSKTEEAVTATSDKIWLPAVFEIYGESATGSYSPNPYERNKQAQYDYYKNGASTIRYQHTAPEKLVADSWWSRSVDCTSTYAFCFMGNNGNVGGTNGNANGGLSFVPCFTIS